LSPPLPVALRLNHSLAWALQMDPSEIRLPTAKVETEPMAWRKLFQHPRSLAVSWLGNLGAQTGIYGLILWMPTLLVQELTISPSEASKLMIAVTVSGFVGRIVFSFLSDAIGRRASGGLMGLGADFASLAGGLMLVLATFAGCGSSDAQQVGNAGQGRRVAQADCAQCHGVDRNSYSSNLAAPTFDDIANVPGMTSRALIVTLRTSLAPCRIL